MSDDVTIPREATGRCRVSVTVTKRKQYRQTAAIWWHCECGCTYGTVRAATLDDCDQAIDQIAGMSPCRSLGGADE